MLCKCSLSCPPGSKGQRAAIRTSQRLCKGETSRYILKQHLTLRVIAKQESQSKRLCLFSWMQQNENVSL